MIGWLCCGWFLYWLLLFMSSGLLLCLPSWFSLFVFFLLFYVLFLSFLFFCCCKLCFFRTVVVFLFVLLCEIFCIVLSRSYTFLHTNHEMYCSVLYLCPFRRLGIEEASIEIGMMCLFMQAQQTESCCKLQE